MTTMMRHLFAIVTAISIPTTVNGLVQVRPATSQDISAARKILFQEAMNPLSISEETLLVATTTTKTADDKVIGFGQIRPLDSSYSELASLYVYPEYRHKGVGSTLVANLLERHDSSNTGAVCLLTLQPTVPFYIPHGFEVQSSLEDLPQSLQLEFKAGSLLSSFLGNDICCMVR